MGCSDDKLKFILYILADFEWLAILQHSITIFSFYVNRKGAFYMAHIDDRYAYFYLQITHTHTRTIITNILFSNHNIHITTPPDPRQSVGIYKHLYTLHVM